LAFSARFRGRRFIGPVHADCAATSSCRNESIETLFYHYVEFLLSVSDIAPHTLDIPIKLRGISTIHVTRQLDISSFTRKGHREVPSRSFETEPANSVHTRLRSCALSRGSRKVGVACGETIRRAPRARTVPRSREESFSRKDYPPQNSLRVSARTDEWNFLPLPAPSFDRDWHPDEINSSLIILT